MKLEADKADETEKIKRETLIRAGFTIIAQALRYNEGELTLETEEGENLAHQMGLLLQNGAQDEAFKAQKQAFLKEARDLIKHNRFVERNQDGP